MPAAALRSPGTPCWTDLGTTDLDDALDFYADLLHWQPEPVAAPEAGGYTLLRRNGRLVAGAGALTPGLQDRPWWDIHVAADVAEAAARVEPAGGRLLAEPFDVLGLGSMAVISDPAGAQLRLLHGLGAELVNEPGSLAWAELISPDPTASADFYRKVLGWRIRPRPDIDDGYAEFFVTGHPVAGIRPCPGPWPHEKPEWLPYFAVADCNATLDRATGLGARLVEEPRNTPVAKAAVIHDRQGALFGVAQLR